MDIREKAVVICHPENSKILATVYKEDQSKKLLKTYFAEVIIFPVDNICSHYSLRIIEKTYYNISGKILHSINCKIKFADSLVELLSLIPANIKQDICSQIMA